MHESSSQMVFSSITTENIPKFKLMTKNHSNSEGSFWQRCNDAKGTREYGEELNRESERGRQRRVR